jgi:hypothetical protein
LTAVVRWLLRSGFAILDSKRFHSGYSLTISPSSVIPVPGRGPADCL